MKNLHAVILALAVPVTLAAQAAGGPPPNPITTALRGRIVGFYANLGQAFDSIPESKFGYKPTPLQLTIGYIAQHVASDNYLFCNRFGDKKATISAKDSATADTVKAKWPKDSLVAKLKASFAFCQDAMGQLDDAHLTDMVPVTPTRSVPRANAVVNHSLDLADHYSQIANYMRLNNILPPTALPRPGRGGN
jgi:DinB family protein